MFPPGKVISLVFDDFDVSHLPKHRGYMIKCFLNQVEYNSNNCDWDFLEVRSGATSSGPFISKLCGRGMIPSPITSTSNYLFLRFFTDYIITGRGWQISFQEPQFTTAQITTTISTTTPTPSKHIND